MFTILTLALTIASAAIGSLIPRLDGPSEVCALISSAISPKSNVYHPGSAEYQNDIFHWSAYSSQPSACTVEPGTVVDVGKILLILGQTRTPFGVKSGGHATNPNFSSTPGVLITMSRFNKIKYNQESQTVEIGIGLIFDDVYAALSPYNVSVVGARQAGVGVGGFILGGGYSWKTNQYGLAIDTVTAFELVKPDGKVVKVTEELNGELFFGLRGGLNNFGIVTSITMKTSPQTSIWGGTLIYTSRSDVTAAVKKFSATNTDPKANMGATYNCGFAPVPIIIVVVFYDAPSPPQGLFDDFFKIPALQSDVHEQTLLDFITSFSLPASKTRIFDTVPISEYSQSVLSFIQGETVNWCAQGVGQTGPIVSYVVEPVLPNILSHSKSPSAYPPTRDKRFSPFNVEFAWQLDQITDQELDKLRQSISRIRDAVTADGQDIADAPKYPNYALFDTPLEQMYGCNLGRLRALRNKTDPLDVMGLTGGFRF